jgi:hypothetical protein
MQLNDIALLFILLSKAIIFRLTAPDLFKLKQKAEMFQT